MNKIIPSKKASIEYAFMWLYRFIFMVISIGVVLFFASKLFTPFVPSLSARSEIFTARILYSDALHPTHNGRIDYFIFDFDKLHHLNNKSETEAFFHSKFNSFKKNFFNFRLNITHDSFSELFYYDKDSFELYFPLYTKKGVFLKKTVFNSYCLVNSSKIPCTIQLEVLTYPY